MPHDCVGGRVVVVHHHLLLLLLLGGVVVLLLHRLLVQLLVLLLHHSRLLRVVQLVLLPHGEGVPRSSAGGGRLALGLLLSEATVGGDGLLEGLLVLVRRDRGRLLLLVLVVVLGLLQALLLVVLRLWLGEVVLL